MKDLVTRIPQRLICSIIWLLPLLAIVGARFNLPGILLAMNILIVLVILGVGFGFIKGKYIPLSLFFIGLGLLWQTSLQTNNLVGTDIHTEYYYYNLAENGWDTTLRHTYNSAVGITVVAPFLHKVFMIEGMWTFKFLYPICLALTPMIFYFVYRTFLKGKAAFLAALLFMAFPAFIIEVVSITKFQLASLMFSLILLVAVRKDWSWKVRLPIGVLAGLLCSTFYYTFGYILFAYLIACLIILGIMRLWPWISGKFTLPYKGLLGVSIIVIGLACTYFGSVAQGDPLRTLVFYAQQNILTMDPSQSRYAEEVKLKREAIDKELSLYYKDKLAALENEPVWTQIGLAEIGILPGRDATEAEKNYLMRAGLGFDILKVDIPGKIFRLLQILTEVFIVLGCVVAFIKRKKIPSIILAIVATNALILFLCIFKPGFSALLNITRLYLITLYLLAPMAILGGYYLLKKVTKGLTIKILYIVLALYFIFSSGLAFEVLKRPNIESQSIPYSIGLSSYRIDICGLFTDNDERASNWVMENLPIDIFCFADLHGMELMYQWTHARVFHFPQNWLPQNLSLVPNKSWVFLREWNEDTKLVTSWSNTGLRSSISYDERGVTELLEGRKVIFRAGKAVVYGEKEE